MWRPHACTVVSELSLPRQLDQCFFMGLLDGLIWDRPMASSQGEEHRASVVGGHGRCSDCIARWDSFDLSQCGWL